MSVRKSIGTKRYILQRLGQTILIWFLIVTLNFFIFRVMPGDPAAALIGENMPPDTVIRIRETFGLDEPLLVQYGLYLLNLFRGEFGESFDQDGLDVLDAIFDRRFTNTFVLMGGALIFSIIIGMVFGVIAAARRGTKTDTGSTVFFLVTYSIPVFWIGLLMILFLGFQFNLIPIAGTITRGYIHPNLLIYILDYGWHMIGPCIVLTLSFIGGFYLIMRDSVLDVFTQDYMLAAEAKGLKERTMLYRHAMRNAMLPMVSVIAVNLPYLISGAMITEYVFSWEGLGLLTYDAVLANDYPVLQGIFLFLATITVASNFVADLLYLYLDPRIRY
ncbi:MAG: ABC transporter permease [Candidatus Thorarchaeota archaeon]|nr:ABC transporter permease [Candidatus Thorarchaeota archaeon]